MDQSWYSLMSNDEEKPPGLLSSWFEQPHVRPGLGMGHWPPPTHPFRLLPSAPPAANHKCWWCSINVALSASPWRVQGCGYTTFETACASCDLWHSSSAAEKSKRDEPVQCGVYLTFTSRSYWCSIPQNTVFFHTHWCPHPFQPAGKVAGFVPALPGVQKSLSLAYHPLPPCPK